MPKTPIRPLGEQLREARAAAGMSAAAVARELGYVGVDSAIAGVVYKYETDRRQPGEETLMKLAQIYGRAFTYIKEGAADGPHVLVTASPGPRR
jgi:transcriptional regulator with XRE-family HTH domain